MIRDKHNIKKWLDDHNIKDYKINDDFTVDVDSNVRLINYNLTSIPVQFGIVNGSFNCSYNQLQNLQGSPQSAKGFICSHNFLNSLKNSPKEVYGNFDCSNNLITDLMDGPQYVENNYCCSDNKLISLLGCPPTILDNFDCSYNQLTSLQGGPKIVNGFFYCIGNLITSLKYCPDNAESINFSNNPIDNINEFNVSFRHWFLHSGNIIPELSNYYVNVEGVPTVELEAKQFQDIFNKIKFVHKLDNSLEIKEKNTKKIKI
jgi:hypothetical protein